MKIAIFFAVLLYYLLSVISYLFYDLLPSPFFFSLIDIFPESG